MSHSTSRLLLLIKEGRIDIHILLAISATAHSPYLLRSYCYYFPLFPRTCAGPGAPVSSWFLFHCLNLIFCLFICLFPKKNICLTSDLASSQDSLSNRSLILAQPLKSTVKCSCSPFPNLTHLVSTKPVPIALAPFFLFRGKDYP